MQSDEALPVKVQVAIKLVTVPTKTLGEAGVTAIELSTALQVRVVCPAMLVAGSVAVIVGAPAFKQVAG